MALEDDSRNDNVNNDNKESAHTPHPADTHGRLPLSNNEDGHETKRDAVRVERYGSLDRRAEETLNDVVVADGQDEQRGEPDQERRDGQNHEVQVVVKTSTVDSQSDGE